MFNKPCDAQSCDYFAQSVVKADMPNSITALAPCAFCGSDKVEEDFGDESACVRCRNCGAQSGRVYFTAAEREADDFRASEAEARAAWNRRPV